MDKIIDLIDNNVWTFAKTMADSPHWYIVRNKKNSQVFDDFVNIIRDKGYKQRFIKTIYTYLDIGSFTYWTMGAPTEETIIINRMQKSREPDYNLIADKYDSLFTDKDSLKENKEVMNMIKPYLSGSKILDLGCGTGLLLDYLKKDIKPENYLGVDPSSKMLKKFLEKHPDYFVALSEYENISEETRNNYNFTVSLFGAINYVNPLYVYDIATKGKYFLMFYKDTYHPTTYKKTHLEFSHYQYPSIVLKAGFQNVQEFNNYNIVSNL